jgi:hypothetical protein
MLNHKCPLTIVNLLLLCFFSSFSYAELPNKFQQKPLLDNYPGYMKYEEPIEKGTVNAKILTLKEGYIVVELHSPAYNFHGVEALPKARTEAEKQKVINATRAFLEQPQKYFSFLPKDSCSMEYFTHQSKPVTDSRQAQGGATSWYANTVRAEFIFDCWRDTPETIVMNIFSAFPKIKVINAQLIVNDKELRRIKVTPDKTVIKFIPSSPN